VPDNQDYADLGRLLASPDSWSDADAVLARLLLRNQEQAVATAHPRDVRRRAGMQAVVDDLRAAVTAHERRRS
jgi:hypothetical protein